MRLGLSFDELALLSYLSTSSGRSEEELRKAPELQRLDWSRIHFSLLEELQVLERKDDVLTTPRSVFLAFDALRALGVVPHCLPLRRLLVVDPLFEERYFEPKARVCFVLMPFSEPWSDRVWRIVEKIVVGSGFHGIRADELYGDSVVEDIWTSINEATLIIADLTSRNPNVFYELGVAHTVGKPAILLSQSESDIPFDLRHKRCILYQDNADGYEKLQAELPRALKARAEDKRSRR
jgi:hypothetical protein